MTLIERAHLLGVAGAILAATGCADPEPQPLTGFQSGDRLRASYYELAGGVKVFKGFHDTARGEDCEFFEGPANGRGALGVDHCLPRSASHTEYFADPDCSVGLAWAPVEDPPSVIVFEAENSCDGMPEVHELGEAIGDTAYELQSNGWCVAVSLGPGESGLRPIGPTVPLDAFVHAMPEIVPVTLEMGSVDLVASDGARLTTAGYDRLTGQSTLPSSGPDGHGRWWPRQVAFSYSPDPAAAPGFADALCTKPVATKDAHDAYCPIEAVVAFIEGGCGGFYTELHSAGAEVAGESLYHLAPDGACRQSPGGNASSGAEIYVEMGDVLPSSVFAESTTVESGAGRVARLFAGTREGVPLLPFGDRGLLDRELGVNCSIGKLSDGTLRCIPASPVASEAFLDPVCETRAFAIHDLGCGVTTPPVVTLSGPDGQPAVHRVAGERAPATLYGVVDGMCTASQGVVDPSYHWFEVGPEIPTDSLPLVTEGSD